MKKQIMDNILTITINREFKEGKVLGMVGTAFIDGEEVMKVLLTGSDVLKPRNGEKEISILSLMEECKIYAVNYKPIIKSTLFPVKSAE